jgi:hypothetical protein
MSKLTKKQTSTLLGIVVNLTGVQQFINSPDTIVARRKRVATTTLDFTLPDGGAATAICKDIGSELVHLYTAIEQLRKFIAAA